MKKTIVYTTDGRQTEILNAAIYSAHKFIPDAEIVVLTQTNKLANRIYDKSVKIENISRLLTELGYSELGYGFRRHAFGAFFKLLVPLVDNLKDLEQVLVLDSDVLIHGSQFAQLFTYEALPDSEASAAADIHDSSDRIGKVFSRISSKAVNDDVLAKVWEGKNAFSNQVYVNQGVMLWYPASIDKEFYRRRLDAYYKNEHAFEFAECDFVNAFMRIDRGIPARFHAYDSGENEEHKEFAVHYILEGKVKMHIKAVEMGFDPCQDVERVVVYESDGGDQARLRGSLWSMRRIMGRGTKVYILTSRANADDFPHGRELQKTFDVQFIHVSDTLLSELGLNLDSWRLKWPFAVMYKMLLPFIPELAEHHNVLHLDTDTVVASPEALNLFRLPTEGLECHGAKDISDPETKNFIPGNEPKVMLSDIYNEMVSRVWSTHSLACKEYINVGVVVFHLDEIRKDLDWYSQRLQWGFDGINRGIYRYPEQDVTNWFLTVGLLNPKYNRFSYEVGYDLYKRGFILHYASRRKRVMSGQLGALGYTGID